MLYSEHLVIVERLSINRPNLGQTLIKTLYIADTSIEDTLYSEHYFLEPVA